ncbi:hypothetical protein [Sphingomonas sp.]|jgi:hypothetical protein
MPDPKIENTPPAAEESGAGYGNNAQTDDVGAPAVDDEQASEAHPS